MIVLVLLHKNPFIFILFFFLTLFYFTNLEYLLFHNSPAFMFMNSWYLGDKDVNTYFLYSLSRQKMKLIT